MYYPKECYSTNETVTRNRMKEYDIRVKNWYNKALSLYPNYHHLGLKDRLAIRDKINNIMGYRI